MKIQSQNKYDSSCELFIHKFDTKEDLIAHVTEKIRKSLIYFFVNLLVFKLVCQSLCQGRFLGTAENMKF